MKIAVIGAGIAGIGAALELTKAGHPVTLFEAAESAGGHAHAVDVQLDGLQHPVDTGFLVLNERTYPELLALFEQLEVPLAVSDMSFSASLRPAGVEWSGTDLASVFAQRTNLASPRFLRMLADIIRFNRIATRLVASDNEMEREMPLDQWLNRHRFGSGFRNWYLLPMAAAIWSCPMSTMRQFPVGSFVRFFHNHGLLQVVNRPQWFTVQGSSRVYVDKALAQLKDVRLGTPVRRINRHLVNHVQIITDQQCETFDAVVLACHSTQSLAMLDSPSQVETQALGAIAYQANQAWLHTDTTLMPRSRRAWSAWNYMASGIEESADPAYQGQARVSVTYWLNKLQPLPFETPIMVTLNPMQRPAEEQTIQIFDYEHPVFDQGAITAQADIRAIQGQQRTWYCGAWMGYGFHEDGLRSAIQATQHLLGQLANAEPTASETGLLAA